MENKIRILIIGAGPSGLSTLRALKQLQLTEKYEIICIEKQPDWSGQWNYTKNGQIDQYGQRIHSSMYKDLWTNIPKQCFQFPDYTFQQHFGKSVPSYLPRQIFKGYFLARFQKTNIKSFIKFRHCVNSVTFNQKHKQFQVIYTDMKFKQTFEYVVVATGHFSAPNVPGFQGIQSFKGKILHSHSVRQFDEFEGKNVLVIGGGFSGEDITLQCYKFGAKRITWTYRNMKRKYNLKTFLKQIQMLSGLSHFNQNSAYFSNGQKRQIDVIIMCTGYVHQFPFLEQNLRLKTKNVTWPPGLYKSVVFYNNPNLFYVGMGNYLIHQLVFDVQGYLIRDIVSGKHKVPDLSSKHSSDIIREKQIKRARSTKEALLSVTKYIRQLMIQTEYPDFQVENIIPIFYQSIVQRCADLLNYRDKNQYKSVITGQISCSGSIKWINMKNIQSFKQQNKLQFDKYFKFD